MQVDNQKTLFFCPYHKDKMTTMHHMRIKDIKFWASCKLCDAYCMFLLVPVGTTTTTLSELL